MKLAEIIEKYIPGDWGNEVPGNENPYQVSCIRGADIVPIENVDYSEIPYRYISERSYNTRLLSVGDIIIEKSGGSPTQSTGRVSIVTEDLLKERQNIVCSNFCEAFRVKSSWNPWYVYYYFRFIYDQGVFFNFEGKTSGLKNLQMDNAFSSIEIEEFDRSIQDKVANAILDLDTKIAINHQINRKLEAMAKQLYDYWFIQFDFPDANGRPYKTSGGKMVWNETLKREIPEGWEVKNLPYIASFTNGLACQRFRPTGDDCGLPVIKISNMHGEKSNEKEFVKSDIPESVKVYDGDILFSWSASLEVIIWAYGIGGLNQHIFKVTEKNGYSKYFVYHKLLGYVDQFRRIAQARKTTMGHITSDHLNQSTIEIPDNEIIYKSFDKEVAPIYSQIISNSQEVIKLQGLKDFILPLLMTGQVTIE